MKIGWVISGPRQVAGARLHGYLIHDYLTRITTKRIQSNILYASKTWEKYLDHTDDLVFRMEHEEYDLIIIVGFSWNDTIKHLIMRAKQCGILTVYIKTDDVDEQLVGCTDATFVVTEYQRSILPKENHKKIFVITDSYGHEGDRYKIQEDKKEIKLVFVSNNVYDSFPQISFLPDRVALRIIGPPQKRIEKFTPGKKMFTDTPYSFEYVVWDLESSLDQILAGDVGIIPYPEKHLSQEYILKKSTNRLILFMSLALPTIVSPVEGYEKIIHQGKNGFIAKNGKEWQSFIQLLRDKPPLRKQIGIQARKDVLLKYSIESQAKLYLTYFEQLLKEKKRH